MTDVVDSLPDRPLQVADCEAIDASSAPVRTVPVSWYGDDEIVSLLILLTGRETVRPVVIADDEFDDCWAVVDRPHPDRGFDELGDLLRPWFESRYDDLPGELAVVPPDYDDLEAIT